MLLRNVPSFHVSATGSALGVSADAFITLTHFRADCPEINFSIWAHLHFKWNMNPRERRGQHRAYYCRWWVPKLCCSPLMSSCRVCLTHTPSAPPPRHTPFDWHGTSGSSIASCYYSTLDDNVTLPVMRADSIAQIAKALAQLLLIVFSPPFVTLNFIVE